MPTYEYKCDQCSTIFDELRRIVERDYPIACHRCGENCERVMVTPPSANPWDEERKFPNLSAFGDGTMTFKSQVEYESHLKANKIGEKATDAPVYRPHGNRVVMTDKKGAS